MNRRSSSNPQRGWVAEETFDLLRSLALGYCCVDEPQLRGLMPPIAIVIGPVAYVRFHGATRWAYAHDEAWERYDYSYSASELNEWVPRIRELDAQVPLTLVYFNNHYVGQATKALMTSASSCLAYSYFDTIIQHRKTCQQFRQPYTPCGAREGRTAAIADNEGAGASRIREACAPRQGYPCIRAQRRSAIRVFAMAAFAPIR